MVVATGVSVPLSTAGASVATVLFFVFWLVAGGFAFKGRRIGDNPVALGSLALYVLFVLGLSYSTAPLPEAVRALMKYRELLLIPLYISVMQDPKWQRLGYYGFLGVMMGVIVLSYGQYLGWLPSRGSGQEYTVFKGSIAGAIFLAFTVFAFAHEWLCAQRRWRWWWGICFVAGTHNLFFMYPGRTGYLVFFALMGLLLFQLARWRGLLLASLGVCLIATGLFFTSTPFTQRLLEVHSDIEQFRQGQTATAVGERLVYYRYTAELVARHPLLGTGTGSFAHEYARLATEKQMPATGNPHNEYLLVMTQLGGVGLLGLLGLWGLQWRLSGRLDPKARQIAQGVLVTMAVGCLFNSLLLDTSEGHFYAFMTAVLYARLPATETTKNA